ncbi:MAG TPA: hypothetical protein VJS89_09405 [Gammaproteobacteria bacterium]|nr:hypothetical protein [Gammaproteobacteria bacterium]
MTLRRTPRDNRWLLLLPLLLLVTVPAGCASYGGSGANRTGAPPSQVELLAPRLVLSDVDQQAKQGAGFTVALAVRNSLPQLYYRYRVESAVNGNYFMMPAPPKIFRIYRVPFYKSEPENVTVKLTITNLSDRVLQADKAVCAFDLNGKTAVSIPLQGTDVLPGHTDVFTVRGPDITQFARIPPHGTMTFWLYGFGVQEHAYRWDVTYQYSETKSQEQAELIGTTPDEEMAKSYEGREEPAQTNKPGPP